MLTAQRNEDGSYQLAGHPAILRSLLTIPGVLRKIIEDPTSNSKAAARLFPPAYLDQAEELEHRRLLEDDVQKRQLQPQRIEQQFQATEFENLRRTLNV